MAVRAETWALTISQAVRACSSVGQVFASVESRVVATSALAFAISLVSPSRLEAGDHESDRLKELQTSYVAGAGQKMARAYHFGSQGPGDVFSNHTSHTNRLVPVYVFGKKADLAAVMGVNSRYRDPEKIKATYGFLPENTVNPGAVYADQSDLYWVQKEAVAQGVKAPVHRLVRRSGLADHAGGGDCQDRQGLHRGQGIGPGLPGL